MADPQQLEEHLAGVRQRLIARVNEMSLQKLTEGSVALLVAEIINGDEVYEPAQIDYDNATVDFHHHQGREFITYAAPCTDSVSWTGLVMTITDALETAPIRTRSGRSTKSLKRP